MSDPAEKLANLAALAEPLRRQLYLYVSSEADAVSRNEAAEHFAVPRSVAAFHLDKLAELGLLEVEYRRPPGRTGPGAGRPAKFYRSASEEVAFSVPPREYELAGRLLAEAVTVAEREGVPVADALSGSARKVGRSLGERARRVRDSEAASDDTGDDEEAIALEVVTECGYEPEVDEEGVTLSNCPFHALAQDYRDLVCGMNLELMTGVLEGVESGSEGEGHGGRSYLEARLEPTPGHCCVRLVRREGTKSPSDAPGSAIP